MSRLRERFSAPVAENFPMATVIDHVSNAGTRSGQRAP
jgi:hypothetical protein